MWTLGHANTRQIHVKYAMWRVVDKIAGQGFGYDSDIAEKWL